MGTNNLKYSKSGSHNYFDNDRFTSDSLAQSESPSFVALLLFKSQLDLLDFSVHLPYINYNNLSPTEVQILKEIKVIFIPMQLRPQLKFFKEM